MISAMSARIACLQLGAGMIGDDEVVIVDYQMFNRCLSENKNKEIANRVAQGSVYTMVDLLRKGSTRLLRDIPCVVR